MKVVVPLVVPKNGAAVNVLINYSVSQYHKYAVIEV
ncbi:MAG: hypothetical protein JWP81_1260 [Ferruginibacter sp.]|nr:hypothetical protein [Ferruginibacter sp.]